MSIHTATAPSAHRPIRADEELRILFNHHFSVELALSADLLDEAMALRYQVYCHERPFEDARHFPDGRERDAYDHRSVHALVRDRGTGECAATVRLVLSDEADPSALFPVEAHCGSALPESGTTMLENTPRRRVGEISRLAVSREIRRRVGDAAKPGDVSDLAARDPLAAERIMPCITVGLFAAVVRISSSLGITHWLAVMEPTLLRLLKRYGIGFGHIGRTVEYHGRRKPAVAEASKLVRNIRTKRPDVWQLITDAGSVTPPEPRSTQPIRPVMTIGRDRKGIAKLPLPTAAG